jgi:adenine-specific DNA-methyltransferase
MKYMGSKRWMLQNGLGSLLTERGGTCQRFIDLFAGSGAVSAFVATKHKVPCFAYDLQLFSSVLTNAILSRSSILDSKAIWRDWEGRASLSLGSAFKGRPEAPTSFTKAYVYECRDWCNDRRGKIITSSYGGHYFSPQQALWIDALRATLPKDAAERVVALSALIQAASQSAASPGHTAQPFQPTRTAKKYIEEAWNKSITERTEAILSAICSQHALSVGGAFVLDANEAVKTLQEGDLVFIDPPYSGVHYSRFYHVLETIASRSLKTPIIRGRQEG